MGEDHAGQRRDGAQGRDHRERRGQYLHHRRRHLYRRAARPRGRRAGLGGGRAAPYARQRAGQDRPARPGKHRRIRQCGRKRRAHPGLEAASFAFTSHGDITRWRRWGSAAALHGRAYPRDPARDRPRRAGAARRSGRRGADPHGHRRPRRTGLHHHRRWPCAGAGPGERRGRYRHAAGRPHPQQGPLAAAGRGSDHHARPQRPHPARRRGTSARPHRPQRRRHAAPHGRRAAPEAAKSCRCCSSPTARWKWRT